MAADSPAPADLRDAFEALARAQALPCSAPHAAWHAPTEAADLVQETLLRAFRTFAGFRPGTNGRAWLFTILYSVAANDAARFGRRAEMPLDDPGGLPDADWRVDDAELALLRRLDAAPHVERALGQLSAAFRDAVVLVDMEDLTHAEAAGVLGYPVGTLRSRLFRGRRQLFDALRGYARAAGLLVER